LLKKPEEALKYVLVEYELRPNNIDVNKVLAEIYYMLDNPTKSQEHLQKALVTGTKDPETRCLEGVLLAKTDKAEDGVKQLQVVFASNPNLQCRICDEARAIVL